MEETQVQELVRDYLRHHQLTSTLETLESELKSRPLPKGKKAVLTAEQLAALPRLYSLAEADKPRAAKEAVMEKQLKALEKNYAVVVQCGRQLLTMALDMSERLEDREMGGRYKAQLGKFHKMLVADAVVEGEDGYTWFNEANLTEVRVAVAKSMRSKDYIQVNEAIKTLRMAALSVLSKHRRKIVDQMIKNDVLSSNPLALLKVKQRELKTNVLALVSMLASTGKGVAYLLSPRADSVVQALVEALGEEEAGSVGQRFAIAALQKIVALEEAVIGALLESGLVPWLKTSLLERSLLGGEYMHSFCLDFGSALLANLLNSQTGSTYMSSHIEDSVDLAEKLLLMLTSDRVESSTIIHLLILLTTISAVKTLAPDLEHLQFSDKISEFVEWYSQRKADDSDDMDNRKTILDMCAHLFHPRENSASALDTSEVMEFNAHKHQDDIRELEQRLEDENEVIIFECFPDEVSLK
jgi:hypothetical protein